MDKQQIKEAAAKASEDYMENTLIMSGPRGSYRKGFIAGAEWRIKRVWHNDLKIGEPKKPILVRFKNGLFMVFEDIRELKGIESEVEMFAYLEDLIPNTED